MHLYPCSYLHIFPSFFLTPLSICVKKGESILVSILESIFICIWLLCTFSREEIQFLVHILRRRKFSGEIHKSRGRRHFLWENLILFVLHYVCFLVVFMVLWVTFSINSLLFSSNCVYVLDKHTSLYFCAFIDCMFGWSFVLLCDHCSHFHMTVKCLIKLLICFTSCLLDHFLLVTLYFSFYYLICLEGLMCFVQVLQVTGIYIPSSSQVLDLGVNEFFHYSQTHV